MRLRHLGYACQNVSLSLTTGRTLRLANLQSDRLLSVIEENLLTLEKVLVWNVQHGIHFFRISSEVIPFGGHADFPIDWQELFGDRLERIRNYVAEHELRLSMHPGQYTVLNSPRPEVVQAALKELDYHARFIRAVDPRQGTITLHVGGAYGDKPAAIARFGATFARLSTVAQQTLILENDDKTFQTPEVLGLCEQLNIPMVFDLFHHKCNPPAPDWQAGLEPLLRRIVLTWQKRVPKFHLSSLKPGTRTSHADFIESTDFFELLGLLEPIEGGVYDLMLEAKEKDRALLALQPHLAVPGK